MDNQFWGDGARAKAGLEAHYLLKQVPRYPSTRDPRYPTPCSELRGSDRLALALSRSDMKHQADQHQLHSRHV